MPAAPASRAAGREVTPVELFRLLPAHFAAVLVCTLLGGILAFAAARLAPRSYQAEAQLYVAAAQEGLTSGYAELQLTADYQELLTSRTMLESVISTLGLSTDTAHLKDQITICTQQIPIFCALLRPIPPHSAQQILPTHWLPLRWMISLPAWAPPRPAWWSRQPRRSAFPGRGLCSTQRLALASAFCSALLSSACITCGMTTFIRRTI